MKVLQLGKFYPIRGGVEKVMWDLTRGLSARGVDCTMLCATLPDDPVDEPDRNRCRETAEGREIRFNDYGRVVCVPALAKKAATMLSPAMIRWLRRHAAEFDLIHIHHPDPMAALALRLSGYKGRVVLHWHSDILSQRFLLALYRPLQRWLVRRADRILGTTPVYVRESPDLQGAQGKVGYVPIGIDPVIFEENAVRELRNRYKGRKIVVSLGRLVPYKGYSTLIDAAALLDADYQVLIGGMGPLRESLQAQIDALGLQDRVQLLGYVPDGMVPTLFGACDVFVLSSVMKTEAFGIVQIEAMSCGRPVVATKIPGSGTAWVNEDGTSGLNVEPGDAEALADAIRMVCADEDTHRNYAEGARQRYEALFTFNKMIDSVLREYETLC
ncbi:MAG: glycosyltransferase [Bacteroidales bacterium]|nr:glycosyltransferase [Bacteroidales bacterium]